MSIIKPNKTAQSSQNPSKRVGSGQSPKVSSHEGSQLNRPTRAGVRTKRTPHL